MSESLLLDKVNTELNRSSKSCPFSIDGRQNGVLIRSNDIQENGKLLYINCIMIDENVNYELVIVSLNQQQQELITTISLVMNTEYDYCSKINKVSLLKEVKIRLTQNPLNPTYFKIEISEGMKSSRIDKLYILRYDGKLQKKIFCQKINLSNPRYMKAEFHPFCKEILLVLSQKCGDVDIFQYENSTDQVHKILFKNLKSSFKIGLGDYVNNFCFPDNYSQLMDKFTIYLQTSKGSILAIFPVIFDNIIISQSQKDQLTQFKNNNQTYNILYNAISNTYIIKQDPNNPGFLRIIRQDNTNFTFNHEIQLMHLQSLQKRPQDEEFYCSIFCYTVQNIRMIFQTGWVKNTKNFIKISLLPYTLCSKIYEMYPLAIYTNENDSLQEKDALKIISSNKHQLYLSDGNYLYQLNFECLLKACRYQNFKNITFPKLQCLFKVQNAQKTICLIFASEGIYLIRQKQKKITLDHFPVSSIEGMISINQIYEKYNKIVSKIEIKLKNMVDKVPTQISTMINQKLEQNNFKQSLVKYQDKIKGAIDKQIGNLQQQSKKINKLKKTLNEKLQKRKQVFELLNKIKRNNQEIQDIFSKKLKDKQNQQILFLHQKLAMFDNTIKTFQNKNMSITPELQDKYKREANEIINKLRNVKEQLKDL